MSSIIEVRNLSKLYRLGQIGRASMIQSARYRWRKMTGRSTEGLDGSDAHMEIEPERSGPVPNSFWAIKDISFDVEQGEVLGIIGRNGAGKSTLLKVLSRITEPTQGYAKLRGRVAALLEVGTGFHADLTGRENVYLNGTILGLKKPEIDARLDQIVDFSGVEKFIDTPAKRYSSGMLVRLAFAVAAHLDPEILIVDEVLAVGDHDFKRRCIERMKEAARSGTTVILVSHQLSTVEGLCPVSMMVKDGQVEKIGPTREVIADYLVDSADKSGAANQICKGSGLQAKLFLLDSDNRRTQRVVSGQNVRFIIETEVHDSVGDQGFREVTTGLQIFTSTGQFLTALNPYCHGQTFQLRPGRQTVACRIERLPLMSGEHTVHLNIASGSQILLSQAEALRFTVESGDFYCSGMENSFNRQGVFLEQNWSVETSN